MKSAKITAFVFLILGFVLVGILINEDQRKKKLIEIGLANVYSEEIIGIVSTIYQNRGTIRLKLKKDPNTTYYLNLTRNYDLNPYSLHRFIISGDSVYKPKNSYEISVFKNKSEYQFVLGESINKP